MSHSEVTVCPLWNCCDLLNVLFAAEMKRVTEVSCKLQQRINIKFCVDLGVTLPITIGFLRRVYDQQCLCERSIKNWYHAFSTGRTRVTDIDRTPKIQRGRSVGNIQAVQNLVEEDRRLTIRSLSRETTLSYGTVQRILKEDLGLVRHAAKFVPHLLNNRQRAVRLSLSELMLRRIELEPTFLKRVITMDESWMYMYDPLCKAQASEWTAKGSTHRPMQVQRERATGKVLLISFFDYKGIVHREFLCGQTVNKHNFVQIMHRMRLSVARKRPRILRNFHLHMDNASPHTAFLTRMFMERTRITPVPHPPYSPDLAPNDFFFYALLKKPLRGRRFATLGELEDEVDRQIGLIPSYKFEHCILRSWPKRWRRCVEANGEYFEGLH